MSREILSLLFLSAQVYPLMQSLGLTPEQGVLVCTENLQIERTLVNDLKKLGAKQVKIRAFKKESMRNYLLYFSLIQRCDRETDVLEFLDEDMAMKMMFVPIYLPDYLIEQYDGTYLVFSEEQMISKGKQQIYDQMSETISYIHQNSSLVYRELRLFSEEANNYMDCYAGGKLWLMLKAAVPVWSTFFRETHTEEETLYERRRLNELVDYFAELPERFSSFDEIGETVGTLLLNYVNEQSDVIVGDADYVDSKLADAIQRKQGILEKGDCYYVPEELLRSACKPIENVISFLKVKRSLYDEGYLMCNNVHGGNYTTKLLVTNVYGYTCRPRFIKLTKDLVESATSIGFNRREDSQCMLEM